MSTLVISVSIIDDFTGDQTLLGDLSFKPFDLSVIVINPSAGIPHWQRLPTPPSESLEMSVAFQEGDDKVSLQVRSGTSNVARLCASLCPFSNELAIRREP